MTQKTKTVGVHTTGVEFAADRDNAAVALGHLALEYFDETRLEVPGVPRIEPRTRGVRVAIGGEAKGVADRASPTGPGEWLRLWAPGIERRRVVGPDDGLELNPPLGGARLKRH